ncbi:MAG: metallophosphoesterase [Bacilli bacterium]|nr:metallophosphoesterase [Bacilli bacterium]
MSKERELIDKYNYFADYYYNSHEKDSITLEARKEAFDTLYSISEYMSQNLNNIENQDLVDRTMIKGIDSIFVFNDRINKPFDICPPSYQKMDNNRVMMIADLHYISRGESFYKYHEDSLKYIDKALEYVNKLNINELVILGDLVDGKFTNREVPGLMGIINRKTKQDLFNEVSFITTYIRKKLPNIKIRVLLGNHDLNAINDYKFKYSSKYKDNEALGVNEGFNEYLDCYKNNNIKLDGVGQVLYSFGNNILLLEHEIRKPFGLYNPLKVEYEYPNQYNPYHVCRSISGHGHMLRKRSCYNNLNDISSVICPCLKGDYIDPETDSYSIGYPGFLIVESIGDKILVEPHFINKIGNNYDVDTLDNLYNRSNNREYGIPVKYGQYQSNKKIVLEKVIY